MLKSIPRHKKKGYEFDYEKIKAKFNSNSYTINNKVKNIFKNYNNKKLKFAQIESIMPPTIIMKKE